MRIGWKDRDGIVHLEEVDDEEYSRIIMNGQGGSPKGDPVGRALDRIKTIRGNIDRLLRS
jgi:hypothetical protein